MDCKNQRVEGLDLMGDQSYPDRRLKERIRIERESDPAVSPTVTRTRTIIVGRSQNKTLQSCGKLEMGADGDIHSPEPVIVRVLEV